MDGQQPRNTHVMRNYVHEFGHYQKQSSMWSNNKACLAQVEGNIVFNGPRVNCQPLCSLPVLVRWSSALTLFRCVVFCGAQAGINFNVRQRFRIRFAVVFRLC